MALSKRKTPLAVLRGILGPVRGQEDNLAAGVGIPASTIRKLSAGLRPVSDEQARRLSAYTGACARWLADGDPARPVNASGGCYSMADFERAKVRRDFARAEPGLVASDIDQMERCRESLDFFDGPLREFLAGAVAHPDRELVLWKMRAACEEVMTLFPDVKPIKQHGVDLERRLDDNAISVGVFVDGDGSVVTVDQDAAAVARTVRTLKGTGGAKTKKPTRRTRRSSK